MVAKRFWYSFLVLYFKLYCCIIQVFNGRDSDIQWLQRDFGIHVVNMFDTYLAMKLLEMPKFSLLYLVKNYCDVTLNKQLQLSDWRTRLYLFLDLI